MAGLPLPPVLRDSAVSADLQQPSRCGLCGLPIAPDRAAGGWGNSGPGTLYHRYIEDCGPALPITALPQPRLSGGQGYWPTRLDQMLLDLQTSGSAIGDGPCDTCGHLVRGAIVHWGAGPSGPARAFVRHENETECPWPYVTKQLPAPPGGLGDFSSIEDPELRSLFDRFEEGQPE